MVLETTYCILVVSDSVYRGDREDLSGKLARRTIEDRGYRVLRHSVVPNDYKQILDSVQEMVKECDVVLVIGGTGPSPRDISIDVVEKLSWRYLPGFGELFRYLTFKKHGYKAIYSRAGLYVVNRSAVAVVPGSPDAVELALEILVGTIDHVIEEIRRLEGIHRSI